MTILATQICGLGSENAASSMQNCRCFLQNAANSMQSMQIRDFGSKNAANSKENLPQTEKQKIKKKSNP